MASGRPLSAVAAVGISDLLRPNNIAATVVLRWPRFYIVRWCLRRQDARRRGCGCGRRGPQPTRSCFIERGKRQDPPGAGISDLVALLCWLQSRLSGARAVFSLIFAARMQLLGPRIYRSIRPRLSSANGGSHYPATARKLRLICGWRPAAGPGQALALVGEHVDAPAAAAEIACD